MSLARLVAFAASFLSSHHSSRTARKRWVLKSSGRCYLPYSKITWRLCRQDRRRRLETSGGVSEGSGEGRTRSRTSSNWSGSGRGSGDEALSGSESDGDPSSEEELAINAQVDNACLLSAHIFCVTVAMLLVQVSTLMGGDLGELRASELRATTSLSSQSSGRSITPPRKPSERQQGKKRAKRRIRSLDDDLEDEDSVQVASAEVALLLRLFARFLHAHDANQVRPLILYSAHLLRVEWPHWSSICHSARCYGLVEFLSWPGHSVGLPIGEFFAAVTIKR